MINVDLVKSQLDENGIAVIEDALPTEILQKMQSTFVKQLAHPQFNTWNGYQQNEKWRLLIEDLLTLSPAFLYPVINDSLMEVCRQYIGDDFQMTEARGWKTIETNRNFHGWHNDAWYNVQECETTPAQLKMGIYLSDVDSGEFCYVQKSHQQKLKPDHWNNKQVKNMDATVKHVKGKAGTAFLFDTCGIHRQNSPILKKRNVVFFNFHDPSVPIQLLDQSYNRYSPLLLNAAFLQDLTKEQERILGFGDKRYFQENVSPKQRYPGLHKIAQLGLALRLHGQDFQQLCQRLIRY